MSPENDTWPDYNDFALWLSRTGSAIGLRARLAQARALTLLEQHPGPYNTTNVNACVNQLAELANLLDQTMSLACDYRTTTLQIIQHLQQLPTPAEPVS